MTNPRITPTTLTVRFEVNPSTGDLTCSPTVLHAIYGDTIRFTACGLPFAVVAKGLSPLDRVDIRSDGKSEDAMVMGDVPRGVYSFACAVISEDKKIYMDAGCPSIIIDPGFHG